MNESPPPTRLGDFELIRELGSGGMGTVWLARQESLGRYVALKVLAPHISMSPTSLQRFQREAEAGARLTHPNIVSVHAVGEDNGTHYIAQELVEGGKTIADQITADRELKELPKCSLSLETHSRILEGALRAGSNLSQLSLEICLCFPLLSSPFSN